MEHVLKTREAPESEGAPAVEREWRHDGTAFVVDAVTRVITRERSVVTGETRTRTTDGEPQRFMEPVGLRAKLAVETMFFVLATFLPRNAEQAQKVLAEFRDTFARVALEVDEDENGDTRLNVGVRPLEGDPTEGEPAEPVLAGE